VQKLPDIVGPERLELDVSVFSVAVVLGVVLLVLVPMSKRARAGLAGMTLAAFVVSLWRRGRQEPEKANTDDVRESQDATSETLTTIDDAIDDATSGESATSSSIRSWARGREYHDH